MSIENKGTIITPTSLSPNFDALQVMPLDTDRVTDVELTSGEDAVDHVLGPDCELIQLYVQITSTDDFPIVNIRRGSTDAVWPLFNGYHFFGVVEDVRTISFTLPGAGAAVVKVMEA